MRFHITGAHKNTGQNVSFSVEAQNPAEAAGVASAMDVLVARIDREPNPEFDASTVEATTRRLERAAALHKTGGPPGYGWLNALGTGYCVVGLFVILISVAVAVIMLLNAADTTSSSRTVRNASTLAGVASIAQLIVGAFMGAVFLGIGQALLAFRDIARNSWHLPRIETLLKSQ
jgi:hypothetical protein